MHIGDHKFVIKAKLTKLCFWHLYSQHLKYIIIFHIFPFWGHTRCTLFYCAVWANNLHLRVYKICVKCIVHILADLGLKNIHARLFGIIFSLHFSAFSKIRSAFFWRCSCAPTKFGFRDFGGCFKSSYFFWTWVNLSQFKADFRFLTKTIKI